MIPGYPIIRRIGDRDHHDSQDPRDRDHQIQGFQGFGTFEPSESKDSGDRELQIQGFRGIETFEDLQSDGSTGSKTSIPRDRADRGTQIHGIQGLRPPDQTIRGNEDLISTGLEGGYLLHLFPSDYLSTYRQPMSTHTLDDGTYSGWYLLMRRYHPISLLLEYMVSSVHCPLY